MTRSRDELLFRHRLEYALVRAVLGGVRHMSQRSTLAAGSVLGAAFHALDRPHRRLARGNLAAAFPHRSPGELDQITRGVFRHFGRLLMELLRVSTVSPDALRRLCVFDGSERSRQARSHGRGVIYVTGHFGFWELQAIAHGLVYEPIAVVARPLDNPLLHDLLERVRTSTGNEVIYRKGGLRRILRALQQNRGVALLIDQHIQTPDAVLVDFFGRPAATTSAVGILALRTGATVIPVFALPIDDGRYKLVYEHPVSPPADESHEALRDFTQRCTDVLEMYVRRYPEYWLWMHRRWRTPETSAHGMFPHAGHNDA
jgi:KDO2-lipid IV(A) lauroyltransferase